VIVVGDASVLIALERIDAWFVLPALYGEVHLPDAVWREVGLVDVQFERGAPAWLVRHEPRAVASIASDGGRLGPGEAEAIQLALDLQAELLLIDESAGRRVARQLLIPHTGVLGVLAAAKRRGLIPAVAPHFEKLRVAGFWISDDLVARVLKDLGETP
jgi:predicted nucleic acid-binding protein